MDVLIGSKLGNYRLTRLLGKGSFANVYLGEHVYFKTQVAVKVLQTRLSIHDDTESFVKEAQTIAQLSHPHINRVFDFGVNDETPYLVMGYAYWGTLRQRHPRGSQLAPSTIIPYVEQIADALQYAHDKQFIHRDVKPENMLLGPHNQILLSDFGLTLITQRTTAMIHSSASTIDAASTIYYMAPEQIQGLPVPASDQYALAVVVYEWLTGVRPFMGTTYTEIATQHMSMQPLPMRSNVPTLPHYVEAIVFRALSKDPQQRFESIAAFAKAFAQACMVTNNLLPLAPSEPSPLPSSDPSQLAPCITPYSFVFPVNPSPLPTEEKVEYVAQRTTYSFVGPVNPLSLSPLPPKEKESTGAPLVQPARSFYIIKRKGIFIFLLALMILSGIILILFMVFH